MKQELIVDNSISITASPATIWDILTNPHCAPGYLAGFNIQSCWEKGTEIVMKGIEEDGLEIVVARGVILAHTPLRHLEFSFFEPHLGLADRFENETVITYSMTEENNTIILRVIQGDFATGENSMQRYEIALQRWSYILPKVKMLAEKEICSVTASIPASTWKLVSDFRF